jgi:hypothetical protein
MEVKVFKLINKNGKTIRVFKNGDIYRQKAGGWQLCTPSDNGGGYMGVGVLTRRFYVHRLVAEAYLEKPSERHNQVNHKDGDKSNNCVTNLEWVTPSDNIRHAHKQGFMQNRYDVGNITIRPDEDVTALYTDIVINGMGLTEASKKHGFKRTTTSSIVNKRSRRNVTDLIDETKSL